ncbi:MAG: rod shape-determining protein MreC [Clostridia bacterium]|nr:rod shape-determining protein MreC [Clostridia bacterium]
MRFFFRSRQFKVILSVLIALIAVSVIFSLIGSQISPQANIVGMLTAPFRSAVNGIYNGIEDFISAYKDGNKLMLENAELESEVNDLREQLADYQEIQAENEFYKKYLKIAENHPDFKFTAATLISRDNDDPYQSFVINKGSLNGVSAYDPVITDAGLVGFISQVGLTTAKVTTVLSPELSIGALDSRTNDSGVVSGDLEIAKNGKTKFYNLARSCSVAIGDYVATSGEGIFPKGLLIGKIETIGTDKYNTSIYATVTPFANIEELRQVMVITEFDGQGSVLGKVGG